MPRFTLSRRGFLAASASTVAVAAGGGVYASLIEPFWLDVHDETHNFPQFPSSIDGLRIVHLTDLHLDGKTPRDYLREISRRVREDIRPDLVAFTGDLTTHSAEFVDEGAQWLQSFQIPTCVCLGNHDYDPSTSVRPGSPLTLADRLQQALIGTSVTVLRNDAVELELPRASGDGATTAPAEPPRRVWVAGVEDFYTGLTDGRQAVRNIPEGAPRLVLCHNPDAWRLVDAETAGGLILAGHTHGGQIRLPLFGPILLPIQDRSMAAGLVRLPTSRMYVSRGVGYLLRCRFNCRPELLVHRIVVRPAAKA
jgi:predicted MPP superfamily phosphohydrolase